MVDTERVIRGELELLAPFAEVPGPDWSRVRARLDSPRPSLDRGRVRLVIAVAAIAVAVAAAASAAYRAFLSGSAKPVTNGALVIDSSPAGSAQLSTIDTHGRLSTLWRCPRTLFCGSSTGLSWSPDGTRLALVLTTLGRTSPFVGLNVLTVQTRRLAHLSSGRRCQDDRGSSPDGVGWSSDGRWIAYTCGSSKILLVSPTGDGERVISTGLTHVSSPSWSPDSRRLVFSAGSVDHSAIYVIDTNGSHRRLLARGRTPAWSPSSSLVAYRSGTQGSSCGGLRLVDANTGRDASPASAANPCHQFGVRQIEAPEWSPDGTEIAVGSSSGVYVMNADGTNLRRINPTSPYSGRPAWQPLLGKPAVRYETRLEDCGDC